MLSLDLSTHLEPVINLTDVSTDTALALALHSERVKITLDHIPEAGVMVLPVRIIDGMGEIMDRGVVSQKQASLIWQLFDLMMSSPVLRA